MNDPLFMSQALATHGHFNVPFLNTFSINFSISFGERSGSVVECLTRDREAAG